jgi:hypothetical protein
MKPCRILQLLGIGKPALTIPHPEEPRNPNATVANTDVQKVVQQWFTQWSMPVKYQDFWATATDIQLFDVWTPEIYARFPTIKPTDAAFRWADSRNHYYCIASWFNPGVTAHESAHTSWGFLNGAERARFAIAHDICKLQDPLVKLLYSINTYGLTSDIEAHAECYRYLGNKMPAVLKVFYPRLMM